MAEETVESTKPQDAKTFADFQASPEVQQILGVSSTRVKPEPAPPASPAVEKKADDPPEPEKVEATATPGEADDKANQVKRDRSAEGRVKEALAKSKAAEERAERLEKEIEELRKGTRKPEETVKTEAVKEPAKDGPPKLADFTSDAKYKTYDEALEAYQDARDEFRDRKASEKAAAEKEAAEAKTRKAEIDKRLEPAKAKHLDWQEKLDETAAKYPQSANDGMTAALRDCEDMGEMMYHFATHHDEFERVVSMEPKAAYREVLRTEIRLGANQSSEPDKQEPVVSKAPAPAERITGGARGSEITPDKARSQREFESNSEVQRILKQAR